MSPEQRRYLFLQSGVGAAIVNALLNGGIGWAITRGLAVFPVWRFPGIAPDLLATTFGVSFGTVLAMVVQVRIDVTRNKIAPFAPPAALAALLARFPRGILLRSIVLGVLSVPVFATPALAWLALSGADALSRSAFISLKAGLAAVEGGLVTPVIVLAALSDLATVRGEAGGASSATQ